MPFAERPNSTSEVAQSGSLQPRTATSLRDSTRFKQRAYGPHFEFHRQTFTLGEIFIHEEPHLRNNSFELDKERVMNQMHSELGESYSHGNRAFLQALLAHSTMTFEESQPIIAAIQTADSGSREEECRPEQVTEDMFHEYLDAASRAASLFDYEIRTAEHQITKQRIFALVNTTSDPQTQLATTYNPEELAFIKRVLDAMFDKFNRPRMESLCITEMQAIKLARPKRRETLENVDDGSSSQAPADKGLKHSEVEAVLTSLLEGGWFEKSREGFYSLSPRALLELRPWLIDCYNDPDAEPNEWQRIKFCEACKDIVTYGMRCSEPDCTLRLHDICQEAFWRSRRGKTCPKCSREWTGDRYIGERSITMTEAYQRGRRRSGARRSTLADDIVRQQGMEESSEEGEDGQGEGEG